MQDWLTLSENRMIWQTIRGRIIPFFWSNPSGHHVDLLLILLTRNKLSLSWNVFVNNVSHQQHLKNRYIFQLAIIIDKTRFHFFKTILRQCFFQKLLSCTISSDSSLYIHVHAIFFKTKLLIIVTNDDNAMHKKLICWKTFLSSLLYTLMHVKKWKSDGTKRF